VAGTRTRSQSAGPAFGGRIATSVKSTSGLVRSHSPSTFAHPRILAATPIPASSFLPSTRPPLCHRGGCSHPCYFDASTGRFLLYCGKACGQLDRNSPLSAPLTSNRFSLRHGKQATRLFTEHRGPIIGNHNITSPAVCLATTPNPRASMTNELGPIVFYNKNEPYYEFTNFVLYPIDLDGKRWPSSEHYFQAQKFGGGHAELIEKIRKASTCRDAFLLSRTAPSRKDWDEIKDQIMERAVLAKFTQHPSLKQRLLFTGQRLLIEHTANDNYWGDGGDSTGLNILGKLLMQYRDHFRRN